MIAAGPQYADRVLDYLAFEIAVEGVGEKDDVLSIPLSLLPPPLWGRVGEGAG
jgi:hypothetical protein